MILHIPHSSTNIRDYNINNKERELLRMTDHFTDELYSCKGSKKIVFSLSRLICDVERFEDDEFEVMSRFGMGVCYSKNTEGGVLREVTKQEKEYIVLNYYRPHHQKLANLVDEELQLNGSSLIVDCHSFPDKAYYFNNDFNEKRPDICIGTDISHTPKELLKDTKIFFEAKGYKVNVK